MHAVCQATSTASAMLPGVLAACLRLAAVQPAATALHCPRRKHCNAHAALVTTALCSVQGRILPGGCIQLLHGVLEDQDAKLHVSMVTAKTAPAPGAMTATP
jgi:hypothetical protein